ncbi:hypothetical protein MAIT1_01740 [Magnetofaba australis IT-1]|uniref:dTDP-glucose 4,6-dehydratase n=2 Tax=Magnetofaba TaxID=1472292 RepID=A0A1Y2K139_9PROT|nr:hypothetical protein MAIT1_01740 [Magnetofaba australis IT-1]
MQWLIQCRLKRREALKGSLLGAAALALGGVSQARAGCDDEQKVDLSLDPTTLAFKPVPAAIADDHQVSGGYVAEAVIRWGDAVLADAPAFDPSQHSAEAQAKQFGYNNDFLAFMPLPAGSDNADHGLLCVNHEYVNPVLMAPEARRKDPELAQERAAIEMAAHGHTVVEIKRNAKGQWEPVAGGRYNRRITAHTPMTLSGPAAGHARLRTHADPSGAHVLGTLNNCAGGVTPWGTILTAEENFHKYFDGHTSDPLEAPAHKAYGLGRGAAFPWAQFEPRFDLAQSPREPNRFGWVVEIDPYDPQSTPVKHTALGRFKHEAATTALTRDGRVVVYSGDDETFQFLYRFVSARAMNPNDRQANLGLLDEGVLSVARFSEEGTLQWLPLIHGQGPLTAENGFHDQGEVLIETRRAAALLGATPMDRPEDVEPNPVNGKVYVMLTNNKSRQPSEVDPANPRCNNQYGHVLELTPPGPDAPEHDAETFRWDVFLLAGPLDGEAEARYHPLTAHHGSWMAAPDNCCFDKRGRLWITTDQGGSQAKRNHPDGVYGMDVDGPGRGLPKRLYAAPRDAELCGPCFTPDNATLFVAVQHPSEHKKVAYENPTTRWPDFDPALPPRPAVVAIRRVDGGPIGG